MSAAKTTLDIFLETLFSKVEQAGIDNAEAYIMQHESFKCMMEDGDIGDYSSSVTGGLSLRALIDGKMGTAYTQAFDDDAADMLVSRVKESASLIEDESEQFLYDDKDGKYAQVETTAKTPQGGTADEKIAFARAIEAAALSKSELVKKLGSFVGVMSEHTDVRIKSTGGLDLVHSADYVIPVVDAVAVRGDKTYDSMAYNIYTDISDADYEALATEAVEEAVYMLDAESVPSGQYDIIIKNRTMADLLSVFSGIFSAENTQKNLSLLKGKVGEIIAAESVTLIDDPLMPRRSGSRAFDDEGVPTYTKNVIENGKLNTLLYNLKTAKIDGVKTTGNGFKGGYTAPVKVAPTNLYIKPGEDSLDALYAKIGDGLVITDLEGMHAGADAITGDFSLSAKGYSVKSGKKTDAVTQITLAGNFFTLLKDVKSVGSDLEFSPFSGTGSPSVWVGKLSVAGK
jgi:PmbA protein